MQNNFSSLREILLEKKKNLAVKSYFPISGAGKFQYGVNFKTNLKKMRTCKESFKIMLF